MAKLVVTQKDAADMLGDWGDRRLRPASTPSSDPLDFSLDATCDDMLRVIADDPEGDLSIFPRPLLRLAWVRVLWGAAAAIIEPFRPVMTVDPATPRAVLLQALIGGLLAQSRVPQTEAGQLLAQPPRISAPGSHRLH